MNFDFTSEQTQLADTVRRLVDKDYGFDTRKKIVMSEAGTSDAVWTQLVELGLTALPVPEAQGGFDGTAVDLLLVMQELGRGLVAEPYFATVFAAEFIKRGGSAAQRALLGGVADGSLKMAAALGESDSRHDLTHVAMKAEAAGDGYTLTGRKSVVLFGAQADQLIVSARIATGDDGLALFVVDARTAGVTRKDLRTLDGQRVAEIFFDHVALDADALIARGDAARELLDAAIDFGIALLCAEAVGVMEAMNAATLDYAKTRKQFGQPIARFQVLQHRMVDMFMHLEQARSMAYLAAVKADSSDALERRRTASAAKVRVGQAMRYIGQQAVQIHGGMGVTNELPAAHLFKRLTMIELTLGDTDHHLQRFIAASAVEPVSLARPNVTPLQRAA
ncbi:MAG: acyl-CoA dehydrogenase family protein [Burkholderiaceae bacterium]